MVHIDIGQYRTDDVSLRAPRFICLIFPILQSSRFQVCAGLPSASLPVSLVLRLHPTACGPFDFLRLLRRHLELCKISGFNNIANLLRRNFSSLCLRLALPVTRQHPRLTNGGSLRFAARVFHPLNYPPFSGRTQPLTEPSITPFTKCFCTNG